MINIATALLLCLHLLPGRAAIGSLDAGILEPFNATSPPASKGDVVRNTNRRTREFAARYSGATLQGPSGNVAAGSGGGYGPGTFVNQGSSGTIVAEQSTANTVTPLQLTFSGVPVGYQLPAPTQTSIIEFLRQILLTSLDPAFQLIDITYAGTPPPNAGQNGGWQGGVQNQNGQTAWNNQNSGGNGWQGGVQNQNGQTAWNNQNSGGNGWQGGVQNQNGQTAWNNQNDIYWAVNGQNQNGQTAWNNQNNGNGANGSGSGIDWASNGSGNGNGGLNGAQNGGLNGAQGGGLTSIALPLSITVNSSSNLSSSASSYVLQALLNNIQVITNYVKPLDMNSFAYITLMIETSESAISLGAPNPSPGSMVIMAPMPTEQPSTKPTREPVAPDDIVEKTFPLQFNLDSIAPGYIPSALHQAEIQSFIAEMVRDNLDSELELSDLSYSSNGDTRHLTTTRRLEEKLSGSMYLPVDITLKGPADAIDDGYPNLLDIADKYMDEILEKLKEMDPETFKDAEVSSEAFDVEDLNSDTKTVTHPVQFVFNRVEEGYELSKEDRISFIGSLKELLNEGLDVDLELIQVAYASRFELDVPAPQLPVRITVRGPSEESDQSLSEIMKVLEELKQDLGKELQSLDPEVFEDVRVTIGSVDMPDVDVPTFVTEHPVQVIIKNVKPGYVLTTEMRTAIIVYVKELVSENLDVSLELIDVEYAGATGSGPEPNSITLPLRVTVRGESDASDNTVPYVIKIVEDFQEDVQDYLTSLDEDAFEESSIAAEPFDFDEIVGPEEDAGMEETDHYVQLLFINAPDGYRLSAADRASIIRFVKNLLDKNLEEPLELIQVAYAGSTGAQSLPLRITVKGPADEADFALAFVMDVLQENREDIEMLAKSQDWNELKDTGVAIESFDPALLRGEPDPVEMEETNHPVQLIIEDVPPGSSLSQDDRPPIVDYLKKLMEDNLAEPIQMVEVTDESGETDTLSLPLRFAVVAPADESELVPGYVMEVLEDHKEDIERMLKGLDWGTFNDANVRFENNDNYVPPPTPGMVETTHRVRLNLDNVPAGNNLSQSDKASIVGFSEQLLDDNLNELFERVGVADVSNGRNRGLLSQSVEKTRRLDTNSLPLLVTVRGPADKSNVASAYVMEVFENHKEDLEKMLRTLDWNTFKDVDVRAEIWGDNPPTTDTVHPIQFNLENVPSGYNLSRRDRAHIERFTKELLEKNLNDPLKLVEVAHAVNCNDRKLHSSRRLGTTSLPLRVTVRGPTDVSDFALSYVMDVLDEYNQDLVRMLKTLDWVVFDAVNVSLDTHDLKCSNEPMEETSHPVQLNFENLPAGYPLYRKDRPSIIRFVKKLVGDDIDESFELIEVADDMKRRSLFSSLSGNIRRLDTVSLPLLFTVNGPADQSDFAPVYVLQAIRENLEDIEEYLKSLDSRTFKNVIVTIGPYDDIDDDEEDMDTPWWVWFLVAMGLLLFIICFFMCCCAYKRYKNDKKILKSVEEVVEFTDHSSSDKDTASVPVIEQNHHALFPYTPHQIEDEHRETLQIIPHVSDASIPTQQADDSTDMYTIQFFDDGSSAFAQQSAITFALDPPSECNLKLESREVLLALQPPTKEPTPLYADPRSHHTDQSSITSVIASHTNKSQNWFEVYRDFEDQPLVLDEPSLHHPNEKPSYATQPNIVQAVPSVNDDPNALVLYENGENQTVDVEEPSGRYYIEENQSYRSEAQPHANQELRKLPGWEDDVSSYTTQPHMKSDVTNLRSVASSIAHGDGKKKKKKQRNNNRRATMSHIDEQQSYATQSQGHLVQDPGGVFEWDDEASSYITELPPTRTKSFFTQPHTIRSVESSVMPGGPEGGKKQRRSRRGKNSVPQTDGVSSRTGTNNQYYGHSNTFYV